MGYYSSTLQKGSQGSDVKKWQEFLNTQGYGLSVDGDFGTNTYNATIDYQKKNGLTVDGIVGANTWGKAGFSNINTPISAPTAAPLPTYTPHDTTSYGGTVVGKDENGNDITDIQARDDALAAVNQYGNPEWSKSGDYEALYTKYMGRDPFSYDFNADALYQQYKDMYMQQGKMAMQDAMGQAAAMTGGYGNSYAASVGNQAYQQSLQQLNSVIPELYQLALGRYQQEGQDMLSALGLLESDRAMYMEDWQRGYDRLMDAYTLADGVYQDNSAKYYTDLDNKNAASDSEFNAAMQLVNTTNEQNWKTAEWNETQRLNERDRAEDTVVTGGSSNGSGSGSGSGSGNNQTAGGIPDSVYTKAESFESNTALANYLDGLTASGTISEDQADALYAQYADVNEKYVQNADGTSSASFKDMVKSTNGWTVVDNGGANWWWGVDGDAIVKAPNGEQIRLDSLVDILVDEGMDKSDAKSYVKKLQKNLGV